MADFSSLPADQRAAVQLLLTQGQTYDGLADLLGIDADAVRRRAHVALQVLAPGVSPRVVPGEREQVSDYLLGQQSVAEREDTRDLLAASPAARAWARSVADALRPIAPDALPEIPEAAPAREEPVTEERAPYAVAPSPAPRASRLGGALLLAGMAIILAVVVILLVGGGDDADEPANAPTTAPPAQTQTQGTSTTPVAQINLLPPGGGNSPVGLAQVFARGDERAIILAAQGLAPGTYALWLHNSARDARLLGFVPNRVGNDGRFATQGVMPRDARRYRQIVVTRETVRRGQRRPPARPGRIVLQGRLDLG